MNLLPKSHKEFGEKDYWNKFFKQRGKKAFEWYGEYLQLCSILNKYIKVKDLVLIPGCGNSNLSADLYDVGYSNLTNVDVSEVAIKQMTAINTKRTGMKFLHMDATKMSFESDSFNVVLDKGTLDALMPDESDKTMETVDKYLAEIKRVLKLGGRFICVSLLQEHILRKFVSSFFDGSWMFRVVRCHDAEEKNAEETDGKTLPVFVVIAAKMKMLPQLILEVCMAGDKTQRLTSSEELLRSVKSVQDAAVVTNGLATVTLGAGEEVELDVCEPGCEDPRYTLYVVDQIQKQVSNKYGVFIVPQGRETEWLFGTPAGRRQLQDSAKFSRLVVALLHRGQEYKDLDAVKEELSNTARMLAPRLFVGQIPFLSLGSDVGRRVQVYAGSSKTTGDFVIEDVDVDGETTRRLIFLNNRFLVQSEARMKKVITTEPSREVKTKLVVDYGHVSFYHAYMSLGVILSTKGGSQLPVAVLGLGGGSLCMFLARCLPHREITAVDIDPTMLEIAEKHFQLQRDDNFIVKIKDGIDFIKEEAEKGNLYSAILLDMDSKDRSLGLSCPPANFLQQPVLDDVKKMLHDSGQFILNLVCRDKELHDSIISILKSNFKHLVLMKLYDEVNEVVLATNFEKGYSMSGLEAAVKSLNTYARAHNLVAVKCVDIKDVLQSATILA